MMEDVLFYFSSLPDVVYCCCSGYKFIGDKNTNNEAEYSGLILGLEAAMRLGLRNVMVKGDSNLIIQQVLLPRDADRAAVSLFWIHAVVFQG